LQELELKDSPYFKQADLMLKTLPHVAAETCFALKGGTAINLFVRDMQHLSVDIDLTYLPIDEPRDTALKKMSDALARIADAIVKLLLDNEGITDEIRKAFVVYLASHDRPMHELLDPTPKNIRKIYDNEFAGMTVDSVSYEDLIAARDTLIMTLRKELTSGEREFLVSLKAGQPKWNSIGIEGIEKLPAVQRKLTNVRKLSAKKQQELLIKLRRVLEM
jgi:hypothetical protein